MPSAVETIVAAGLNESNYRSGRDRGLL